MDIGKIYRGQIQDFQIEEVQKKLRTQRTSQMPSAKSLTARVQGPLIGPGSSRDLNAV